MSQTLKRSKDRKVTNSVTVSGNARGANSFGLPSGKAFSCPGQTSVCEAICYAGKLEKIYKGVKNVLTHNWDLLNGADIPTMVSLLSGMIGEFVAETDKIVKSGKDATYDFRIHWDGDFFSRDYATAWAIVMREFSGVNFWVYTRSFTGSVNVIDILSGIDNLSLYLSTDKDNIGDALAVSAAFPDVLLASLGDTFGQAREALVGDRKASNCPENNGAIPLISAKGSACITCGLCPKGRKDVVFSISGK